MTTPARLTAGWRQSGRSATLDEHQDCYGPFPRRARPGALAQAVAEAGLTGRGGAGLPTGTKLRAVPGRPGPPGGVAHGLGGGPATAKNQAPPSPPPPLALPRLPLAAPLPPPS